MAAPTNGTFMDESRLLAVEHLADALIDVGAPITIGDVGDGVRRVVPILGGSITGPRFRATILAAGADYQIIRPQGVASLDARYVARTDDGAMIYIVNTGIRYGTPDITARLTRGEFVDPALVYFRTTPRFETASSAYEWLTQSLFIASAVRHPERVELRIFTVM